MSANHLAVADAFSAVAACGATVGWFIGFLTPLLAFAVLLASLAWYLIQIGGSDWWKRRKQRRHRAHMRRHRSRA